jgi:Lar family restriction alleviation protein
MSTDRELLPCPFCGDTPVFEGDGENWQDERRYVQMKLVCCTSMSKAIGWNRARDMTPKAREAELRAKLTEQWNRRAYADRIAADEALLRQALADLKSCSAVTHWPALRPTINAIEQRLEKTHG